MAYDPDNAAQLTVMAAVAGWGASALTFVGILLAVTTAPIAGPQAAYVTAMTSMAVAALLVLASVVLRGQLVSARQHAELMARLADLNEGQDHQAVVIGNLLRDDLRKIRGGGGQ